VRVLLGGILHDQKLIVINLKAAKAGAAISF
jgi:hypothetical protein